MYQDYWQYTGLYLCKTGCASKSGRNAATNAQDIKGCSIISTLHHSLVLDKAHLVFSSRQTVCHYTYAVFLGFVYRINAFLGKGQCRLAQGEKGVCYLAEI